ncbi:hypothetical protein LptCag_2364 [Leptospirillum ferriphilum]|uniref:Uncharacterized protein n=1 Tax=Leptospirillum ferriphilum TaxID=178606 RepID=A0A094WEG6_9BACT|nr:hypothetical protein LptCag_2364 [Leptospirillum ferriphilum]
MTLSSSINPQEYRPYPSSFHRRKTLFLNPAPSRPKGPASGLMNRIS